MLPEELRAKLGLAAASTPGVTLMIVFGSTARGNARPTSDVDVGVLGKVDLDDLATRISALVHREVDVIDLAAASIPLIDAIIKEGVTVFEGERGADARFRSHALAALETDRPWFDRMQSAWLRNVAARGILGRP